MHKLLGCFFSSLLLCSAVYWWAGSWDPVNYNSQKPFLTFSEVLTVGAACWWWEGIWKESKWSLSAFGFRFLKIIAKSLCKRAYCLFSPKNILPMFSPTNVLFWSYIPCNFSHLWKIYNKSHWEEVIFWIG